MQKVRLFAKKIIQFGFAKLLQKLLVSISNISITPPCTVELADSDISGRTYPQSTIVSSGGGDGRVTHGLQSSYYQSAL